MKNISTFLIALLFCGQAAQAIVCTATYEHLDEKSNLVIKSQDLKIDTENTANISYVADMGESYYFVQSNKLDNSYLLMITLGPEYTKGVTASMTWDSKNRMRISRVDGYNVYKLSCENK
jgi:hypothetical protein